MVASNVYGSYIHEFKWKVIYETCMLSPFDMHMLIVLLCTLSRAANKELVV